MAPENSTDIPVENYDPKEHLCCYIFEPTALIPDGSPRPAKRRRSGKGKAKEDPQVAGPSDAAHNDVVDQKILFPALLNGKESPEDVKLRWDTYNRLWDDQERRINGILDSFNQLTLENVSQFVKYAVPSKYDGNIPTALVLTGPNIASHAPLFIQFAERIQTVDNSGPVVVLTSKDASNLKATLKKLIKDATTEQDRSLDLEDEDQLVVGKKGGMGPKLLNYDLQILQDWCANHKGRKIVVAIQDTAPFESTVLADLISLLNSYLDRIPFVLLLGIATSLEIFHDKLPKATIRMMQGEKFDVQRAEECLAKIFDDAMLGEQSVLRLGPSVCRFLVERQKNHTQSIQTFVSALKYAYMSHFYANPLSVIIAYADKPEDMHLSKEHLECIRNLPSFRRFIEFELGEDCDISSIRRCLEDDSFLEVMTVSWITRCRKYARQVGQSVKVFESIRSISTAPCPPSYELFQKVLTGELHSKSPMVRDLLLSIKKMNSRTLWSLIEAVKERVDGVESEDLTIDKVSPCQTMIENLESQTKGVEKALASAFDTAKSDSLRSTAVSKKIQQSQHKLELSKDEIAYTQIVQKVHDILSEYFEYNFQEMKSFCLYDVFFYDLNSPHGEVFAPRARATIERALSRPVDYLGCECCELSSAESDAEKSGVEGTIKSSHPPTCIIYQLYLEGGALINSYDLWNAFFTVIEGDHDGGGGEDQSQHGVDKLTAQALFYRSVAELKFLGFVKNTRKRVDHLQKLAWKGL